MSFSASDIPILAPISMDEITEWLKQPDATPSTDRVEQLTAKVDGNVASFHACLDSTLQLDLKWRLAVYRGEAQFDQVIEEGIRSNLESWVAMTDWFLSNLDRLRSRGFAPSSLETLRPRLAEVRAMLTPDGEFFEGDELDELTAQALEEDERGRTVEFRVMGE